ncbi:MAG TPA: tRNA (adenosine(37)-N6)-threonylcarbamoyltransferase complex dimerization subunit type 1 TsaB [Phycisphaerae bacterium]|nr:tRNA (adenosine(37)-N6)-threonylcarbamoyltransferase complex dimerization subunit type 1 TsaB [Phycisphaerae bacterium]
MGYSGTTDAPRSVALETSSRIGAVAVGAGAVLLAQRQFSSTMRHAVELMPTLADLVKEQGWKPADIQQVYVSVGPGSFTGVRIAVTAARALNQALGCKLVAVPTVDILAANAPVEAENLGVILDAKRGQVYAARYRRNSAGELQRTAGPMLGDPREFVADSPRPLHLIGEGIDYHRPALFTGVADVIEVDKSLWTPQAAQVHRLGWQLAQAGKFTLREELLPIYLRKPEAQEVWEKKHGMDVP